MAPDINIQAVREYNIARNKTIRAGVDEDNIIHTIRPRRNPVRFIN